MSREEDSRALRGKNNCSGYSSTLAGEQPPHALSEERVEGLSCAWVLTALLAAEPTLYLDATFLDSSRNTNCVPGGKLLGGFELVVWMSMKLSRIPLSQTRLDLKQLRHLKKNTSSVSLCFLHLA